MAKLRIICQEPTTGNDVVIWYDNQTSELFNDDGSALSPVQAESKKFEVAFATSKDTPAGKSKSISVLKIQLGLSCNYECTYCNQRFVPHAESTNPDDVEPFLQQLPTWFDGGKLGDGSGVAIEFWGGEPFVYWKTLKPLAERLRQMYPNIMFTMITNGSLLDVEKNEWLDRLGFNIGMSHDGPGHHVRGEDPFDNPEQFANIKDLISRLAPKGRFSINSMLNKDNQSREAISKFFNEKFGFDLPIGEGGFVDPYDEGGASASMTDAHQHMTFRLNSFTELRNSKGVNFTVSHQKISGFIKSIAQKRPANAIGQRCGMDKTDNIAVDLNGNVLTCQNVSPVAVGMNGESHKIGHVTDFENIKLKTATHWSKRAECPSCPVLQICHGSCMFLHGNLWELGCDNSYSDNIPYFMAAIEMMTGLLPYYIDGDIPENRKDIIGAVNGIPSPAKKFPIPVVAA